jgi:hypothetical protein
VARRQISVNDVEIGPANRASFDSKQKLTRSGTGNIAMFDLKRLSWFR